MALKPVITRRETVTLPTYLPERPDPNPMFLEKRVYQGSSGRVYPLPFTDRIAERATLERWDAVFIENDYLLVMLLPQLGGRIHRIQDKTNGYDAIYYQPVIKPALVGLAGPWCSGGIEFNWPQHHRPSTFLPTDVAIEQHDDGAATVWMSEHDPMARMKGMHGVRLHPGRSLVELVARVYNRTEDTQTFLWWANVATRVHEGYRSFFPPDVAFVADHAKRAMSTYPRCNDRYYGLDYAARARGGVPAAEIPRHYVPPHCREKSAARPAIPDYSPDDLSWYANIPVPTSYMCLDSTKDFFGGYDYKIGAGLIHIADHHIAPGKKQWTWGNHEFGYAWDRNLTDPDPLTGEHPPYIELMAGVFTDNQPDFSFLQPGETRTWSQYWYPYQAIGPVQHANTEAAVSFSAQNGRARVGVAVTAPHTALVVRLEHRGKLRTTWKRDLTPARPLLEDISVDADAPPSAFTVRVTTGNGRELIAYTPTARVKREVPPPATEPAAPADMKSNDELFLTGLHLEQYRHATRPAELYWREALRRDPGDARCHLALGRWHLRRGEFSAAEQHLRASIARLTARNPNPADGEAFYQLGVCRRHQWLAALSQPGANAKDHDALLADAYAAFYKATWNHAWQSAAFHALAEIDAFRGAWTTALDHLDRALQVNTDNLRARNLRVIALRQLERHAEAQTFLRETLRLDPVDAWARFLNGETLTCDHQVRLDLALDCARAGLFADAITLLRTASAAATTPRRPDLSAGTAPLLGYALGWLHHLAGAKDKSHRHLVGARRASPDYCFPSRLEEIAILEFARQQQPSDARAPFYLGNLFYDRRRHREAIACWEQAVKREPSNAVAWRNLGIGYFNILRDPARARRAYDRAARANPRDARVLFERDQLWKRLGESPRVRLRALLKHPRLVAARDDLSVELCALYNQTGRSEKARELLAGRKFQPWEGGEGQTLGQHVRTHLALGRRALENNEPERALTLFSAALAAPDNLGEARHFLANSSDVHYWLGCAHAARGDDDAARAQWKIAAQARGDFTEMTVRTFSEMSYFSALALEKLGNKTESRRRLRELLAWARKLGRTPAVIDYFATSLPTMLLFDDDLSARQKTTALFLEAQARLGLGQTGPARKTLHEVLRRDPNHALAADLLAAVSRSKPTTRRSPRQ